MNDKDPYFQIHYFNGNPVLVRWTGNDVPFTVAIETIAEGVFFGKQLHRTMHLFDTAEQVSEFMQNSQDAALAFYDSVHELTE